MADEMSVYLRVVEAGEGAPELMEIECLRT